MERNEHACKLCRKGTSIQTCTYADNEPCVLFLTNRIYVTGSAFMKKMWNRIKEAVRNINTANKFLMVFMLILFIYIIFHLFTGINDSQDINAIDVIVRTSIAAIFGYFISSNFSKTNRINIQQEPLSPGTVFSESQTQQISNESVQNKIGFQVSSSGSDDGLERASAAENLPAQTKSCDKVQIFVVSAIGIVSLVVLFAARYTQGTTPEITAIISQLRDLVSACIGFLVSCGKSGSN